MVIHIPPSRCDLVCDVFVCVHSVLCLPVLRICNVSRDALNACHSAQGCARVCTES